MRYWDEFETHEILALRSFAPEGVFTSKVKDAFLAGTATCPDLVPLGEVIFGSDLRLVTKLPESLAYLQPELTQLVQLAYRHKIRPRDARVASA